MKGAAGLIVLAIIIAALILGIFLSQNQGSTGQIVVVANASFNSTTYVNNQTNLTINNTIYTPVGGVTIPFDNVTGGTGTGEYTIKQSGAGAAPFAVERWDIARNYFNIDGSGNVIWYQDGTPTPAFKFTVAQYQNEFASRVIIETTGGANLIDFQSDDGSGSHSPQKIVVYGNMTYDQTTLTDQICETHKGSQANYSRCFNATGQVTERIGVFPV
jgi:hypothetical protein